MPTYVDVGVVRIQQYIARTKELKLRRGASWRIMQATAAESVDAWISTLGQPGVRRNGEAGDVSGVVSLSVPEGQGKPVVRSLLLHLREQLPGAELQGRWFSGPTYLDALASGASAAPGAADLETITALPPLADVPLAETCKYCRAAFRVNGGETCTDCAMRERSAGWRSNLGSADSNALGVEKRLLEQVNQDLERELTVIDMLEYLAPHGEPGGRNNHLATVAADGNALGAFFSALAEHGDSTLKKKISPMLSEATFAALVRATGRVVVDRDTRLPVVPHVVGGDDVVVTVVADRVWPFASAFLSSFAQELSERARQLGVPEGLALPSISAGIAFTTANYPYSRAVELAELALRQAKREHAGRQAALCWLDVTEDGERLPAWRTALTLAELRSHHQDLQMLRALPAAGRHRLARLLANPDEDVARGTAMVWARRMGDDVVPRLLDTHGPARVRNLVAATRWWRGE